MGVATELIEIDIVGFFGPPNLHLLIAEIMAEKFKPLMRYFHIILYYMFHIYIHSLESFFASLTRVLLVPLISLHLY